MKKINNAITVLAIVVGLFSQSMTVFAQEWSTTYPSYDTGSWSTTYPSYDTGSWSTTYPSYDTGSWSTTYPSYDTGSWSTTYPSYDTGSWSTTYPSYDTGSWSTTYPSYDTGSWSTTYPSYDTGSWSTTYPTYDTGSWSTTNPVYTEPSYTTPTYTSPSYTTPSWTGYDYTNYSYTQPTYTQPVYTQPTYTNPVVTTPAPCPAGYTRLANGTCVPPTTGGMCPMDAHTCPNGTTVGRTGPNCQFVCPTPTTPVTVCSDGLAPVNGSCVRTTTIPTYTNTICSDGLAPVNGSCVRTVVTPTINYQVCWDGSRIPYSQVCPAQYKVCANGTSIPVNQQCYFGNTYVPYVPPTTIKFNNVITSVATEITLTSARCNGIGLIASGVNSTGWFEYGETANLGRETSKANIGSSPTAPFSNVLVNLKPTTKYYCRAVMQNQYGTVKGEIVAFTTKAKAVAYVKPVTKTTVKTKVTSTKVSAKTNEIVCVDGSVVKVGSNKAADLINDGQKLVSLQIEKMSGNLSAGSQVNYKLTFKNLSDEALTGMTVKVTIPTEITITNASAGTYDPATHILTVNNLPLNAYGEGTITWTGTVSKDAQSGKSLVTTAYTNYTVPGTDVEDEVTAYVVGTVVPGTDTATSTGVKKVVGASGDRGFLPNSLVEWLALIAIIFIIFVLGRSVYTSYSSDRKASH